MAALLYLRSGSWLSQVLEAEKRIPFALADANHRFQELMQFGQLCPPGWHKSERSRGKTSDLARFEPQLTSTFSFIKLLEDTAELKFSPACQLPFLYNTIHWRKELPIAGYLNRAACSPLPTEFLTSVSGTWRLESLTPRRRRAKCFGVQFP